MGLGGGSSDAATTLVALSQFWDLDLGSGEIIYKEYVNIGIAVDTDAGLVVPVIRDVDQKTILELAGGEAYLGMQGTSLVPLLDEPAKRVRDHVLVEEDEMFDMVGSGQPLRMRTLVTDEARISLYRGETEGELSDLESDPDELHNLWNQRDASALRALMTEKLARYLMHYDDASPRPQAMA